MKEISEMTEEEIKAKLNELYTKLENTGQYWLKICPNYTDELKDLIFDLEYALTHNFPKLI